MKTAGKYWSAFPYGSAPEVLDWDYVEGANSTFEFHVTFRKSSLWDNGARYVKPRAVKLGYTGKSSFTVDLGLKCSKQRDGKTCNRNVIFAGCACAKETPTTTTT